jgi:hypothetical protein
LGGLLVLAFLFWGLVPITLKGDRRVKIGSGPLPGLLVLVLGVGLVLARGLLVV